MHSNPDQNRCWYRSPAATKAIGAIRRKIEKERKDADKSAAINTKLMEALVFIDTTLGTEQGDTNPMATAQAEDDDDEA
jgi:hypothetical protein